MVNLRVKPASPQRIRSLLVANRGEIAIRVMRAASELGLRTVAIYSQEDRFSLHRTKADEAYLVGARQGARRGLPGHRRHPAHRARGAAWTPSTPATASSPRTPSLRHAAPPPASSSSARQPETMRAARQQGGRARSWRCAAGVPVMPATARAARGPAARARALAAEVGYPVMLKASWGGGGRGMRVVEGEAQLRGAAAGWRAARRRRPSATTRCTWRSWCAARATSRCRCSGDQHGTLVHLFERDCTAQRRNQKVVERAPAVFLE